MNLSVQPANALQTARQRWRIACIAGPIAIFVILLIGRLSLGNDHWFSEPLTVATVGVPVVAWVGLRALRFQFLLHQSAAWPTVEARIVKSEVTLRSPRHGYAVAIDYQYRVHGRTYDGGFVQNYDWPFFDAEKFSAQFAQGAAVAVRYSPDDPSCAILPASAAFEKYSLSNAIIGGVIVLLIAISAALSA